MITFPATSKSIDIVKKEAGKKSLGDPLNPPGFDKLGVFLIYYKTCNNENDESGENDQEPGESTTEAAEKSLTEPGDYLARILP